MSTREPIRSRTLTASTPRSRAGPSSSKARRGRHVTLARNPNFLKPGKPYLDKAIFRFISDPSSRIVALEAGEAVTSLRAHFPANEIDRLKKVSGITVVGSGAEGTADVATFGFNMRRAPFNNVMVRRALSHAINRDFIQKSVAYGYSPLASGPLHPNSWAFDRPALAGLDYA